MDRDNKLIAVGGAVAAGCADLGRNATLKPADGAPIRLHQRCSDLRASRQSSQAFQRDNTSDSCIRNDASATQKGRLLDRTESVTPAKFTARDDRTSLLQAPLCSIYERFTFGGASGDRLDRAKLSAGNVQAIAAERDVLPAPGGFVPAWPHMQFLCRASGAQDAYSFWESKPRSSKHSTCTLRIKPRA